MKSTVFVRPNLKLFLVIAIAIAMVKDFIANGDSQGPTVLRAEGSNWESDLQRMVEISFTSPSSELYRRISYGFERRGDFRNALLYLRRAEKLEEIEAYQ